MRKRAAATLRLGSDMGLSSDDIARQYRQDARRMVGFFVRRTHEPEVALDLVAEMSRRRSATARSFAAVATRRPWRGCWRRLRWRPSAATSTGAAPVLRRLGGRDRGERRRRLCPAIAGRPRPGPRADRRTVVWGFAGPEATRFVLSGPGVHRVLRPGGRRVGIGLRAARLPPWAPARDDLCRRTHMRVGLTRCGSWRHVSRRRDSSCPDA